MVNNDWMLFGHYFAKESILFASFWKSAHRIAANLCAAAALGLAVFMTPASLACGSAFGGFGWHYTPLNIYNGTPGGRLNRDLRATLPINELKGNPPIEGCPILNLHRCK
jgi:hypothetical protein